MQRTSVKAMSAAVVIGWGGVCAAQTITTEYGIEFCSVEAVGNAPVPRPPFSSGYANSPIVGKGRLDYEFRIGRTEITTAQWMEFVNTFNGTSYADRPAFFDWTGPFSWGVRSDPFYGGPGFRYVPLNEPNAAQRPVFGISWRMAALYCNWLHNGKSSSVGSLMSGAYDVSTFGMNFDGSITDAPTHSPDARFWIPTIDEQVKAFHYDPNRNGLGQGGYWLNKNMRDIAGIPGLPGVGQTSAGLVTSDSEVYLSIPLGAYPDQQSPWGLLDTSGGTSEWSEQLQPLEGAPRDRTAYGDAAGVFSLSGNLYGVGSVFPGNPDSPYGFRIATLIPGPSICAIVAMGCGMVSVRRRRM